MDFSTKPMAMYASTQAGNATANSLEDKINRDLSNSSDEELMEVCKDFQSYFIEQVLKQVEKTVKFDSEENTYASQMVDYFKDTAIQEISEQITEQEGGSFAQMMYEQMKRNYDI